MKENSESSLVAQKGLNRVPATVSWNGGRWPDVSGVGCSLKKLIVEQFLTLHYTADACFS